MIQTLQVQQFRRLMQASAHIQHSDHDEALPCIAEMVQNLMMCFPFCVVWMQAGCLEAISVATTFTDNLCFGQSFLIVLQMCCHIEVFHTSQACISNINAQQCNVFTVMIRRHSYCSVLSYYIRLTVWSSAFCDRATCACWNLLLSLPLGPWGI